MAFVQRVKETRTAKGINQLKMAKTIGLDVSVYNRIEKGLRDCRVDELAKIADVLEVSTDYLLGLTDERDSSCTQNAAPPEGKQLLGSFNNAPTHIKAAILTLLAPYEKESEV